MISHEDQRIVHGLGNWLPTPPTPPNSVHRGKHFRYIRYIKVTHIHYPPSQGHRRTQKNSQSWVMPNLLRQAH